MPNLKTLLFICTVIILFIGCSTSSVNVRHKKAGEEVVQDSFTIKAGGSYEECIELKPGQVFDYSYDSSDFVDFNIHYHTEEKVQYPESKKGRMMGKGMIDPGKHSYYTEEQEFYCLMWDNTNSEPVEVSFSCVLKNR